MKTIKILCITFVILITHGCTALHPFPNVVRGGDTVALAVGSPLNMGRTNTTATFTSDVDGIIFDITSNIRSIFKLYADPASKVYADTSDTAALVESSGHSPWISIVVLDMPVGISVGTGIIEFNTSAVYPGISSHINNIALPIEIIPGTGFSNDFKYEFGINSQLAGDLTLLEPQSRVTFSPAQPSTACPCPNYAAIEVKVSIPVTALTGPFAGTSGEGAAFVRVIPEDLTVKTKSGKSVIHGASSDGTVLTVVFLSSGGILQYNEAQFSIVLPSSLNFNGLPAINSIRYFDIAGNEISGPVADYTATLK